MKISTILASICLALSTAQYAHSQTALTTVQDTAISFGVGSGFFNGKICFAGPDMVYNQVTYAAGTQPACVTVTNGIFPPTQFVPNGIQGVVQGGQADLYTATWRDTNNRFLRSEVWVVPPSNTSLKIYQVRHYGTVPYPTYVLGAKGDDIACCDSFGRSFNVPVGSDNTVKTADSTSQYGWSWKSVTGLLGYTPEPALPSGTSSQYLRADKTVQTLNTTVVPEGTNQYFSNSRARAAFTAQSPISIDPVTGIVACPTCGGGNTSTPHTASLTFGTIPDGTCSDQTFTFTGVAPGTQINTVPPATLPSGVQNVMFASAANTITSRICNSSGGPVTIGALNYTAVDTTYATSATGSLTYSAIADGNCSSQPLAFVGAGVGDPLVPEYPALATGLYPAMFVSAQNVVTVVLCNYSGASVTPSGTFGAAIAR